MSRRPHASKSGVRSPKLSRKCGLPAQVTVRTKLIYVASLVPGTSIFAVMMFGLDGSNDAMDLSGVMDSSGIHSDLPDPNGGLPV